MAYTPLNLTNGTRFTAEHLAHFENGINAANETAANTAAGAVDVVETSEGVWQIGEGGQVLGLTTGRILPAAAKVDLESTFPTKLAIEEAGYLTTVPFANPAPGEYTIDANTVRGLTVGGTLPDLAKTDVATDAETGSTAIGGAVARAAAAEAATATTVTETTAGEYEVGPENLGTSIRGFASDWSAPAGAVDKLRDIFAVLESVGRVLTPSGDTTGATDAAAINAALLETDVTVRGGTFNTNAPIRIPSNRTLTVWDATIQLVPGSNCNVVQNYDQNATGNQNITLQGVGTARINGGNSTTQTTASAYNSIGVTFTEGAGLKVRGLEIGPCRGPAMVIQGYEDWDVSDIRVSQDRSGDNQDGIDIGPGCNNGMIRGITGITGDDAFSIFSQKTAGFCHPMYKQTGSTVTGTRNITISDVSMNVGINPVRLQAGDGLTLRGVRISNFRNTNPETSVYAVIQFGSVAYVTTAPAKEDLTDITLDGYHGPGNVILGTGSHFSYVDVNNVTLTGPWKTFLGTEQSGTNYGAQTEQVSFNNITTTDYTSAPTILNTPSGQQHSALSVTNVRVRRLGNILNNGGVISGLLMNNIHVRSLTGQIVRSSSVETGQMDNVFIQSTNSGVFYAVNAVRLKLGTNVPPFLASDVAPDPATKGSVISCTAGLDPTGGGSTTGGMYVANGSTWVKLADLGASF